LRLEPRSRVLAFAAILAVGASQTSCSQPETPMQARTTDEATSLPVVPVARVRRASIASRTVLTAEFQPFQEVDVMAKVAGYLRSIKVDLGDRVREGQLLAELEIPEMTDEVSRAAATVEQTGAEIGAARDELQRAESSHEIAHVSYTRLQEVARREPGLVPQQEVDEVRSRDLIAEAQVASAKSRLRVAEQKTRVAKAEEARFRTLRNYVTITAPFTGTVTKRYAHVGSMIQAGTASQSQAMPLVRLSQISTLRLSLPVPESLVPAIRLGQPVEVRVKSLERSFEGRIARFASRVDQATRTMITEVDVSNPAGVILPGMYAEVSVQSKQHDGVLTAPVEAIERAGSAARVYTVDKAGVIRIVPVQIGVEDAARAEIVSGLQEADLVITGRRSGLNAGDRVRAKAAGSEE
jgi:RND family efflux transporter MFP subunit